MKGVLICGGTGSRLRPLTEVTNKSLLPVYDQPLIFYPLNTLLKAGVREILVISGPEHLGQMADFLGSGDRYGCSFTFKVQDRPGGIAQALGLAEDFAGSENICAILGDNIYVDSLVEPIQQFTGGGHVFLKSVKDPERFGVAQMKDQHIIGIEEKPEQPKSNLALTGCYMFDHRCFEVIKNLKPSKRGELEITDVANWYAQKQELTYTTLEREWIDAGTIESLHQAAVLVRSLKLQAIEEGKKEALKEPEQTPIV